SIISRSRRSPRVRSPLGLRPSSRSPLIPRCSASFRGWSPKPTGSGGPSETSRPTRVASSSGSDPSVACSDPTGRSVSSPRHTPTSSTSAAKLSEISRAPTASGSSAEMPWSCTGSRCPCRPRPSGDPEVQAYGMALDLRDDPKVIARYKKEHAQVWPAVLARLREVGVTEMKIYLLGRRMFMYCETKDGFDPSKDFARSNDDPTYRKWDDRDPRRRRRPARDERCRGEDGRRSLRRARRRGRQRRRHAAQVHRRDHP